MKTQLIFRYFCLTAVLLYSLPQPVLPQTLPATHNGDGGPVLVVLITEESYLQENRTALHCSDTDECRLCEYRPSSDTPGICHPDHARFYISNKHSNNAIFFTGIDHFADVEITPLNQEHSRHLSCSSDTTLSKMPRCRLQNRTEERNSGFCSLPSFSSCSAFYLMISTLYSDFIDGCILHNHPDSCSASGFITYYQTPVVIKNNYVNYNYGRHKAISCMWASGNSAETGNHCRMVSEQDCDSTQRSRDQCRPQKFILHMEQPYPKCPP